MRSIALRSSILMSVVLAAGCSLTAPQYSASLENVQVLKDGAGLGVNVGHFDSSGDSGNANPISLRGSSLESPYDKSYAKYLEEALKQELSLAGKLAPNASVEISGVLQKNDISIPGIGDGSGDLQARFVIKKGSATIYDKVQSIHDVWDSSFVGAVAIPRAQEQYPKMVQKLLAQLYADSEFQKAIK